MANQENKTLREQVGQFALSARTMTAADRSTVWILDDSSHELWTVISGLEGSLIDVRIPIGQGYVGVVLETGEPLNIPFDLYNDPNATVIQQTDQKIGYRTCSLLCMPILYFNDQVIGVIQLINKRRNGQFPSYNPTDWPQVPVCFEASFDAEDQKHLIDLNAEIVMALQNTNH